MTETMIKHCEKHGDYESSSFPFGTSIYFTECPECEREREKEEEKEKKYEEEKKESNGIAVITLRKNTIMQRFKTLKY